MCSTEIAYSVRRDRRQPVTAITTMFYAVLGIRSQIRIRRTRMFVGLLDPDPDPFFRGTDRDPSLLS